MTKKKTFRRMKVSNMGYVSGKRLQGFRAQVKPTKSQAPGDLQEKKPAEKGEAK